MKKVNFIFLATICFYALTLNASISKIKSYKEADLMLNKIRGLDPKTTWFVFDIDNTLITPDLNSKTNAKLAEQASDGFFYREKTRLFNLNKSLGEDEAKYLAYRTAVDNFNDAVKHLPPMLIVEDGLNSWIQSAQEKGFKTLAFTAREACLEKSTSLQLKTFDFDFKKPTLGDYSFRLEKTKNSKEEDILLRDGVYFVGRGGVKSKNHKGIKFVKLLEVLKGMNGFVAPKTVVFFDDRYEHVSGMSDELSKLGIEFFGFNYIRILEEK